MAGSVRANGVARWWGTLPSNAVTWMGETVEMQMPGCGLIATSLLLTAVWAGPRC